MKSEFFIIKDGYISYPSILSKEGMEIEMLDFLPTLRAALPLGVKIGFEYGMKKSRFDGTVAAYFTQREDGQCYIVLNMDSIRNRAGARWSAYWTATFAHELEHFTQYVSGRLESHSDGSRTWCGETWSTAKIDQVGYYILPWEIEARQAEARFYKRRGAWVRWAAIQMSVWVAKKGLEVKLKKL